jgi:hypothetical protein
MTGSIRIQKTGEGFLSGSSDLEGVFIQTVSGKIDSMA